MADDRPVDDANTQIVDLQRQLADLRSTMLARVSRSTTGTIEPTLLAFAPVDTLLMQGQAVSRTTYAVLWQWVQDNSRIQAGLFTVGDGSTTFGLPDMRTRVLRGAPAATGVLSGADSLALSAANLPGHTHTFTSSAAGNHGHSFSTDGAGNHGHSFSTDGNGTHGGHFPGTAHNAQSGGSFGLAAWNDSGSSGGYHSHTGGTTNVADHAHTGGTTNVADHSHSGTTASTGSGSAVDMRQASIDVNWLVWV